MDVSSIDSNESEIEYTVPKVSIDGKSHEDILLIAVGSGFIFAAIIMTVVFLLITKPHNKYEQKKTLDFNQSTISIESPSISTISKNTSRTNLIKIFGNAQSFDVSPRCTGYTNPTTVKDNFATIFIDIDNNNQYKTILTPSMFDTTKNIKTVVC